MDPTEQTRASLNAPIKPRPRGCRVPLTPVQLRAWNYYFSAETARKSKREWPLAARIFGPLTLSHLQASISAIVQRHEALRTRFVLSEGIPTQSIAPHLEVNIEVVDLASSSSGAEFELRRLAEEFIKEEIDLTIDPLLAIRLYRISNGEHVLILAPDHLISDAASLQVLSRDIWILYGQCAYGEQAALPNLPIQFADYAVWQEQTVNEWRITNERYWQDHLGGLQYAGLPIARTPEGCCSGEIWELSFGPFLSNGLRDIARRSKTILSLVVLTLFAFVISCWCAQCEFVLPCTSAGRYRPELQNLVGLIAHALYLRIHVDKKSDSFISLLAKTKLEFSSALKHHDFDRVPDIVPGVCNDAAIGGFNWVPDYFECQTSAKRFHVADLQIEPYRLLVPWPWQFVPYFYDGVNGIHVLVYFHPAAIAKAKVERFGEVLRSLAEQVTRHPDACLASFAVEIS